MIVLGSSPLARGLLRLHPDGTLLARIIPARAGFTADYDPDHTEDRDHPRSRGVYSSQAVSAATTWGSSPLARGLPPGLAVGVERVGIIPARAGFTVTEDIRPVLAGDHPRSRGVYRE